MRTRLALAGLGLALAIAIPASPASAGTTAGPERSTTDDLAAKRYVAAGDSAYVVGAQDGGFPPMGWHIRGEMGGVWTHPIKLLDGYWFSVNGSWLPAAKRFTSGAGYVRKEFGNAGGFEISATEFAPEEEPVVLVGLRFRNPSAKPRPLELGMDVRSELMASYPWGWTTPNAKEVNGHDAGTFDAATGRLSFNEPGKPWFAVVGATAAPSAGETGDEIWGPVPAEERPDYQEFGNGTGGRLEWTRTVPGRESRTVWIAIAGSDSSAAAAGSTVRRALADPGEALGEKLAARAKVLARTRVSLPDEGLEDALEWGKLNLADQRITVTDAEIRDVDEGKAYPEPAATLPRLTGIGAGIPDYPWYFGTDGAYTAYPLIATGQWDTAKQHLRSIRDVSRVINGATGKVVHEVMTEGSVYFGTNSQAGNTNETAEFASAVANVWRWSGDDAFRDEMYDFVVDGMRYVTTELDADGDGWPEGNGMVERTGMGSEKLDVTAYTWQALSALAEMARSKGDAATEAWAQGEADAMAQAFDARWWLEAEGLYADSLCNPGDEGEEGTNVCTTPDQALQQRHWINATPMETSLAPVEHANMALSQLESPTFTSECGFFHTGVGGGPAGEGELSCGALGSAVMAVAEANYGRLAPDQAPYYIETITNQLDTEMPGALPELFGGPAYDPWQDFRGRAMFMQAWSSYGTQWPVIASMLGIEPNVPGGEVAVVPDVPDAWPGLSVRALRVGSGELTASASRGGGRYVTEARVPRGLRLVIGHVLAPGERPASVRLDGERAEYRLEETERGLEVLVDAGRGGEHRLVVSSN
jgi:hypothetical protein